MRSVRGLCPRYLCTMPSQSRNCFYPQIRGLNNFAAPNKSLAQARLGETYVISVVEHDKADSGLNLVQPLHDLGFMVGEKVTMISAGPFGGDRVFGLSAQDRFRRARDSGQDQGGDQHYHADYGAEDQRETGQ